MITVGDQEQVVGIGLAAVFVLGGMIVKAVNLRGDLNAKWSARVAVAQSALAEKTVVALRELRDTLNTKLPQGFSPQDVSMDPGPLAEHLSDTAQAYRASLRMSRDLDRLLALGSYFALALIGAMMSTVILTLSFSRLVIPGWFRWVGYMTGLIGVAGGLVVLAVYAVWVGHLASDEIRAGTASQMNSSELGRA